jgi:hypothetical protein
MTEMIMKKTLYLRPIYLHYLSFCTQMLNKLHFPIKITTYSTREHTHKLRMLNILFFLFFYPFTGHEGH